MGYVRLAEYSGGIDSGQFSMESADDRHDRRPVEFALAEGSNLQQPRCSKSGTALWRTFYAGPCLCRSEQLGSQLV